METFKEYIAELFDKPYPFSLSREADGDVRYIFKSEGRSIVVDIVEEYRNVGGKDFFIHELFFDLLSRFDKAEVQFDLTGDGDAFKIFATIFSILKKYIKTRQPEILFFSASKKETSRTKLYTAFFKKMKISGYNNMTRSATSSKDFFLVRKSVDSDIKKEILKDKFSQI